jgi:hypothetical protein
MSTGSITTYASSDGIRGIAGLAMRAGRALEDWGWRASQPLTREQLELRMAIEREVGDAVARQVSAYQVLR